MSIAIQFRRGTTANHATFAGLLGEMTIDTTKKTVVLHDGSTLGGTPLAKEVHTHTASQVTGLFYQTLQVLGTAQTAQPVLNLSGLFAATNDVANGRTTVDLATNNTSGAGTYGSTTQVPRVTINSQGLITSVTQVTISGVSPAGSASGDLGSTYPGPSVVSVGGQTASNIAAATAIVNTSVSSSTPSTLVLRDSSGNFAANVITASIIGNITGSCSGTASTITGNMTGDVTSVGMVTTLSASGVTAGTYGSSTQVPHINVDSKGRVTSASLITISGVSPSGGAGGDLSGNFPSPTVSTVGGTNAATIAAGANLANAGTASAVASQLVLRDGGAGAAFSRIQQSLHVVSSSATPTFDLSLGSIQQMVINANTTVALSGIVTGQIVVFDFLHDATTTAYTLTWPANVFTGTLSVGNVASKHNCQIFWSDGTNLYELGQMRTNLG